MTTDFIRISPLINSGNDTSVMRFMASNEKEISHGRVVVANRLNLIRHGAVGSLIG
jgi:hypothetical protein